MLPRLSSLSHTAHFSAQLVSKRIRDLLRIQVKESAVRLLRGLAEHNCIRLRSYRSTPHEQAQRVGFYTGPPYASRYRCSACLRPVRFKRSLAVLHRIGATPAPYADHIIAVFHGFIQSSYQSQRQSAAIHAIHVLVQVRVRLVRAVRTTFIARASNMCFSSSQSRHVSTVPSLPNL